YDRALRHFRNGWYDDSLESIQKSLKKDKTVYLSWFLMGRIYAFGNAINLDEAIIAFNNAIKYITPYIKNSTEIRNIASEIWFWFGVTQYTKSNDCLHNGNNNEALNFLAQARKSFEQSYVYSGRMLESLYNGARCDTLLENKEQALAELEAVIRKDKNYAIKVFDDSDFDSIQADIQKLIKKLRHEAYLQVKPKYDKAVELYDSAMNIGASCSKKHPNQFEEDAITYFEMLDYNNSSVLNNWQKEYENAIDRQRELIARREREEQERQRREQEQQRREQEQQRREQQRLAGFEKLKALEGTADFETNLKSDGTVTIRRYKGKNINIVIPSTIGSMRVTALEGHKIFGDDVRSVVIPYSVRRIDKGALGNTRGYASLPKLRKITIGANVSIEWSANDDNLFGKCYLNNNRESGTYVLKLRDGRRYWKKKKEKKEKGKKKSNSDAITVFIASLAVFAANAVYLLYFGIQSSLSFFITLSGVPFVTALIGSLYMKEKVGIINFIVLCIAQVIEIMVIVKVNMDNLSDFAVPFTVILFSTCGVSMAIGGFIGRKYLQILN
ncbi:MAG: hypothetical protein LBM06_08555, partial [Prevotellaceae bacterium]|nr:hypothetical protein [Prevotellaceae bacterium]